MSEYVRPAGTPEAPRPHDPVLATPSTVRERQTPGLNGNGPDDGGLFGRWWQRRRQGPENHLLSHDFRTVHEALRWVAHQPAPERYEVVVRPQPMRFTAAGLDTVWDQLRRDGTLQAGVELFYDRATRHRQLEHYFVGVDVPRLRRHMFGMLVKVTGGPESAYTGRNLRNAHAHLGITGRDYDLTISILIDALRDVRVPEPAIADLSRRVSGAREEIVAD